MSSGGRFFSRSCLQAFEAKSENMAWSFLGLPTRSLIDGKGAAALELTAIDLRRLSSGVMNPGVLRSADGILSNTYRDIDRSYFVALSWSSIMRLYRGSKRDETELRWVMEPSGLKDRGCRPKSWVELTLSMFRKQARTLARYAPLAVSGIFMIPIPPCLGLRRH
jgi:hypothetical protein